ncbi:hypothetical protein F8S13_19815 [Chloroflexia bacterium SDU3-3]|nr:hypothetical protein F8S13_19815 [Chloroflexia bacterium SDU3-3]
MYNAQIRSLLHRVLIQISIGTAALAAIGVLALAQGHTRSWDFPLACGIEALAFAGAAACIQRRWMAGAGVALAAQALVCAAMATRYPQLAAALAVRQSVGACLMLALIPRRLFAAMCGLSLLSVACSIIRPAIAIPPAPLGPWLMPMSMAVTMLTLGAVVWAGKQIIGIERATRVQLAQSLAQLHDAQTQLLRAAQDKAAIDTAIAATHDLAQPLTVILSEAGMLRAFPQTAAEQAQSISAIERAAIQASQKLHRIREVRHYVPTEYLNDITMLNLESDQAYDPQIRI